tara:strand:- start:1089 stop:1622 length:534 start_codon:yes stop_codon:yes gene_type:complete
METFINIFSERLFSLFCHQQGDLLMQIYGYALPICFRCGFIYIGIFTTFFVSIIYRKKLSLWSIGMFLISILFFEWFSSNIGLYQSTVLSRSISGFIGGVGGVLVLYHYGWKVNDIQMVLSVLILILTLLILSFQTAIITLILLSFLIFWTGAIQVIRKIVLSFKTKGVPYAINEQN